jgi:hypothetical protein
MKEHNGDMSSGKRKGFEGELKRGDLRKGEDDF